jgi:CubicO group peptidase (beta-lactamase class C family)
VWQVLTHEAGIPVIDAALPANALIDWDVMADAVAAQEPLWEPGERHGYHGVTFGWLVGQIVRSVTGDLIGPFLRDEIAGPLGVDCFIGTPASEHHRIAPLVTAPRSPDGLPRPSLPQPHPESLMARMFAPVFPPISPPWNTPEFWSADIPVTNAICTARALAQIYGELGAGGGSLMSRATVEQMGVERVSGVDAVLEIDVRRTLGFELRPAYAHDARPDTAFGHPGASGFLGFADPAAGVGFAYVKNAGWGGEPGTDTRAARLIDALYEAIRG